MTQFPIRCQGEGAARFSGYCRSRGILCPGRVQTRRLGASVFAHVESARVQNVGKLLLRRKLHVGIVRPAKRAKPAHWDEEV